jgi:hypothetical protein
MTIGAILKAAPVSIWKHLWADKVPLVWHMIVVGLAAWGSYSLAPAINEKVERQKLKSEYVSQNLRDMNSLISDFYVSVQHINSSSSPVSKEDLERTDQIAAKLHWKAIEVSAILKEESDQKLMLHFQQKLRAIEVAIPSSRDEGGREKLKRTVNEFSQTSVQVIGAIAQRAEIRQ